MAILRYAPATQFDPFHGLAGFQETMNRLFSEPSPAQPGTAQTSSRSWVPPVDIRESENELVVKADIPDMKFEDIAVQIDKDTLTVRGERKIEKVETAEGKSGWHRMERSHGKFERTFTLPETVNAEAVTADYKNGTLTITLPKKEVVKPRQVKVQVSNS